MAQWIKAADARRPFDLVIANAGITTGLAPGDMAEEPDAVRAIIGINLIGVLNTVEPLIGPMCARGAGQIAFIGSIAGVRGLPYAPSYCATKAAIHAYSESVRGRIEARGVRVSLIIPGFVKTPLNESIDAVKPLEMSWHKGRHSYSTGSRTGQAGHRFSALALYGGAPLPNPARPFCGQSYGTIRGQHTEDARAYSLTNSCVLPVLPKSSASS